MIMHVHVRGREEEGPTFLAIHTVTLIIGAIPHPPPIITSSILFALHSSPPHRSRNIPSPTSHSTPPHTCPLIHSPHLLAHHLRYPSAVLQPPCDASMLLA